MTSGQSVGAARPGSAGRLGRMPSEVAGKLSLFDRFAGAASRVVAGAWFFAFCVLLVVVWLPSYFLFQNVDTWQLIINTLTTIVTFLLVALLQNSQTRADAAVQQKLNAIADALGDLMDELADERPELRRDREELRAAVGLEEREGS
ncbi:low affinity iron permease family protein [Planosporangium sp. 12N6]|uniref:low affinity iron permease family protein n=1 Tax=Planosporangium spinosum TaxID=3402278 RepID=UPI003CEB0EBA